MKNLIKKTILAGLASASILAGSGCVTGRDALSGGSLETVIKIDSNPRGKEITIREKPSNSLVYQGITPTEFYPESNSKYYTIECEGDRREIKPIQDKNFNGNFFLGPVGYFFDLAMDKAYKIPSQTVFFGQDPKMGERYKVVKMDGKNVTLPEEVRLKLIEIASSMEEGKISDVQGKKEMSKVLTNFVLSK